MHDDTVKKMINFHFRFMIPSCSTESDRAFAWVPKL